MTLPIGALCRGGDASAAAAAVHQFRYRAFWLLLDLDELPALDGAAAAVLPQPLQPVRAARRDHGDGSATPLRAQVERQLAEAGIDIAAARSACSACRARSATASIRSASISAIGPDGALAAIIYEVHNTFGERHSYVVPVETASRRNPAELPQGLLRLAVHGHGPGATTSGSPLPPSASPSASRQQGGERVLNACLAGQRRELTDGALLRVFLEIPLITLKVIAAIHWEALAALAEGHAHAHQARRRLHAMHTVAVKHVEPGSIRMSSESQPATPASRRI